VAVPRPKNNDLVGASTRDTVNVEADTRAAPYSVDRGLAACLENLLNDAD
jgi:hypothetical protein